MTSLYKRLIDWIAFMLYWQYFGHVTVVYMSEMFANRIKILYSINQSEEDENV